jgi:hypothetical protein
MSSTGTDPNFTCSNTPTGGPALYGRAPRIPTAPVPGKKAAVADVCWPDPVVRVGFVNPATDWGNVIREHVKTIAPTWSQYANLTFEFVEGWTEDVTVNFEPDPENGITYGTFCSYLGTDCCLHSRSKEASTHLVFEPNNPSYTEDQFRRLILHEFGHALGLIHEHMRPDRPILWNQPAVCKYYRSNFGWNWPTIRANVIDIYEKAVKDQTPFDPKSIMMYPIDTGLAAYEDCTPFTTDWNFDLTPGDIELISRTYPKTA